MEEQWRKKGDYPQGLPRMPCNGALGLARHGALRRPLGQ